MKLSPHVEQSLTRVIEKFKSGDVSPIHAVIQMQLDPNAPANRWSFCNKVLAFAQAGELDCRGFMQWKEMGRYPKKGSRAVYIIKPITAKRKTVENGEEKEDVVCIGFGTVAVFPASATDGEGDIPSYQPRKVPPLTDIAQKLGIDISYVPIANTILGDCTLDGTKIRLNSADPAVFFHELSHAIHARIEGGIIGGQQRGQETVAEFAAAVLMDFYGFTDHTGNAWKYISRYAKDPLEAITKALATVEQVLAFLFEAEELQNN